mmetsp:Transcript_30766/g.68999  ORF Transcript_30766/g.68999 Transcript_30766/m.68999 type:complete len:447 (-) Transcript_30766:115-1455(-)
MIATPGSPAWRRQRRAPSFLLLLVVVLISQSCQCAGGVEESTCSVGDDGQCMQNDRGSSSSKIVDEDCVDEHELCRDWAMAGECAANPSFMLNACRRSCSVCEFELKASDFGKPQRITAHRNREIKEIVRLSEVYMAKVRNDPEYQSILGDCHNIDERCSEWALDDGCDDNPSFMKQSCSAACRSCDYVLSMKSLCALDPNGVDAIEAGGMDELFERMLRVAKENEWQPTVLSRPPSGDVSASGEHTENIADGPWVITLENFLSQNGIDALLDWGAKNGFEEIKVGNMVIQDVTSSHLWCEADCSSQEVVSTLMGQISNLTGIDVLNFESLQLLKYEVGQYHRRHNDYINKFEHQVHGPRVLTFFIYFGEVDEGGDTKFPSLKNLTVKPKAGRVLIWPSVLDQNPFKEDKRTDHEALPVIRGKKFAANVWIHMRDYQTGHKLGCPT